MMMVYDDDGGMVVVVKVMAMVMMTDGNHGDCYWRLAIVIVGAGY